MELRDKDPEAEVSWARTDGQRVSHRAEATVRNLMVVVPIETEEGKKRHEMGTKLVYVRQARVNKMNNK